MRFLPIIFLILLTSGPILQLAAAVPQTWIPPTDAIRNIITSNDTVQASNYTAKLHFKGLSGITITGSNSSKTVYFSGSGTGNGTGSNFTCNDINNCVNLNDSQTITNVKNFTSGIIIDPYFFKYEPITGIFTIQDNNSFSTNLGIMPKNGTTTGAFNDIFGDSQQNNFLELHAAISGSWPSSIRAIRNDSTDFNIENHNTRAMITLSGTDNSISILSSPGGPGNALLHNVTNPIDPHDAMTRNYFENNVGALGSLTLGPCISGNILQVNYSLTPNWNCVNQTSGATGPTGPTGANGSPGSNGATGPTGPTANIDSQNCSTYFSPFSVKYFLDSFDNSTHQFTCDFAIQSINGDPTDLQTITGTSNHISVTNDFTGGHQIDTLFKINNSTCVTGKASTSYDNVTGATNCSYFVNAGQNIGHGGKGPFSGISNNVIQLKNITSANSALTISANTTDILLTNNALTTAVTSVQNIGHGGKGVLSGLSGNILQGKNVTSANDGLAITSNSTDVLITQAIPNVKTGGTNWYDGAIVEGAQVAVQPTANQTWIYPFITNKGFVIDKIGFEVNTLLVGSICMVAIYDDNGTAYPNNVIATGTDQSTTTTGIKSDSVTATLKSNSLYWLAVNCKGAGVLRLVGLPPGVINTILGDTTTTSFVQQVGWALTQNHGSSGFAFSSPFPSTGTKIGSQNIMAAWVRAK